MSNSDPALTEMVGYLASMNDADRDFVLGQLGDTEVRLLAPYLEASRPQPLSGKLRALAAACADGQVPDGVTKRAAAAIDAAVGAASNDRAAKIRQAAPPGAPLRSLFANLFGGR